MSDKGALHQADGSGIAYSTRTEAAASDPNSLRSSRRAVRYGLGLLLVALCVGLAAALFLTIGTARADVFLVAANAAF